MIFQLRIFLIAALGATLLLSCAQKVAGGGSSGSEAGNALTAKFVLADGSPVANARITLRPANYLPGDLDTAKYVGSTNTSGLISIKEINAGTWTLIATAPGTALLRTIVIATADSRIDLGCDTLRGLASAHGSVTGTPAPTERVAVRGTDLETRIGTDGSFHFDSLPIGILTMQTTNSLDLRTTYIRTLPGKSQQTDMLQPENPGDLLLDNFEDRNLQHRFGSLTEGGWWYLAMYPSVRQSNSSLDTTIVLNLTGDSHGTAIHTSLSFTDPSIDAWAEIGVSLGKYEESHDFSSVDSLVFYVRGTGKLQLVVRSSLNPDTSWDTNVDMEENVVWVRKAFAMDMLCPLAERKALTGISWRVTSSADFWLDDIELIGAERGAIWP